MFKEAERLIEAGLQLPPEERLRVADRLYRSVPDVGTSPRQAVIEEAKQRIDEYRRGEGSAFTREESMARARQLIRNGVSAKK